MIGAFIRRNRGADNGRRPGKAHHGGRTPHRGVWGLRLGPAGALAVWAVVPGAWAHTEIEKSDRAGAPPCRAGTGWFVECFYDIPDNNARDLNFAEVYIRDKVADFTFDALYLDWPGGSVREALDTSFPKMGDFLNAHISNVSVPGTLDWKFKKHFLLRATGYLYVDLSVKTKAMPDVAPPPMWTDFGLLANDGGRIRVAGKQVVRLITPISPDSFAAENAIVAVPGLYEVTVTYLERYDSTGATEAAYAGLEATTCFQDGVDAPSGPLLECPVGVAKLTPFERVYQAGDVQAVLDGDFDVDNDVDLFDVSWLMNCFSGPGGGPLRIGCEAFDFDGDSDVDLEDVAVVVPALTGPDDCALP